MPFKPVNWQALEVISSSKLNDMVANDQFLWNRKVAGAVRNIDPSGEERASPRYIKENLVVCAGYKEFRPGAAFPREQVDGVDKVVPVFEREFKFPKDFFDPEFRPVVVCSIGTKRGIRKITWTLKNISASRFTVVIREHSKNLNFESDMEYFINWIAFGVRLVV